MHIFKDYLSIIESDLCKIPSFQPTGSCGKDMLDVPGESDAKAGGIGWTGYHAVWFAEQVTKRHQMAHIPTQRIVGVDPSIRRLFLSFFSGFG